VGDMGGGVKGTGECGVEATAGPGVEELSASGFSVMVRPHYTYVAKCQLF